MFNQYEPNVKATISFLQMLQIKVNNGTVNETLQNHPDWPSMLCISDSLQQWNIANAAGKMDIDKIDELPTPFIAQTIDRGSPLAVIKAVTDTTVQFYHKNFNKLIVVAREDFLKLWNGVYLIAEPTEHAGETAYKANKRKEFIKTLLPISAIFAVAILSFIVLYNGLNGSTTINNNITSIGIYLQYGILLAGVIVTALLLWYEIDKSNPLLQKVCSGIAKGNCNAILSGKHSKVFSWLSWSEVGFFYFTGTLLLLLAAGTTANVLALIGWLNVLALPYTVFSIYYQWRVAKQWCVLCLAVQALLLLGGLNVFVYNFLYPLPLLSFLPLANYLLLFTLPPLIWFALKPYILRLQEAKNTKRQYLRLKFNAEIFDTLLKKQKAIHIPADGLGIDIGNPAASNTIIKVCNPYCGPCAAAHSKLEAILEHNKNVQVKIIFTTPNDEAHHAIKPTRHLMAIAESADNEKTIKQALDNWYLAEKKDYEIFAAKHPMNGELQQQGSIIAAMENWSKEMKVEATPTIFINGYQLPDAYNIEDLEYFLLE
jgi:uncharacterized membrane protein